MITWDEDGLIIDLPFNWRIGFDGSKNWREWGIGVSVYYHNIPNRHIGIFLTLLPFYLTVDIWQRKLRQFKTESVSVTPPDSGFPIHFEEFIMYVNSDVVTICNKPKGAAGVDAPN